MKLTTFILSFRMHTSSSEFPLYNLMISMCFSSIVMGLNFAF